MGCVMGGSQLLADRLEDTDFGILGHFLAIQ